MEDEYVLNQPRVLFQARDKCNGLPETSAVNSDVTSFLVIASSGLSGAIGGGSGSGNLIGDLILVIDQLLLFVSFSRHIYEVF